MSLKVGDRVKIIKTKYEWSRTQQFIGSTGTIIAIDNWSNFGVDVKIDASDKVSPCHYAELKNINGDIQTIISEYVPPIENNTDSYYDPKKKKGKV